VSRPIIDTDIRYYGSCVYSVCSVKPHSHCVWCRTWRHSDAIWTAPYVDAGCCRC